MTFWSPVNCSSYTVRRALSDIDSMVGRAAELGYPAMGLTDLGTMAGAAAFYTACQVHEIKPLPGITLSIALNGHNARTAMQVPFLSCTETGYRNLVALNNKAQSQHNRHVGAVLDLGDLAELADQNKLDGIAVLTGSRLGLLPSLLDDGDPKAIRNLLAAFNRWFSSGVYVQLTNHNRKGAERAITDTLHTIARNMGLPCVIAPDTRYLKREDHPNYLTLKSIMSWSDDPEDQPHSGSELHLPDRDELDQWYTAEQIADGLAGLAHLADNSDVRIPALDVRSTSIPQSPGRQDQTLLIESSTALEKRHANLQTDACISIDAYYERLNEELEVILRTGFEGYILLVHQTCQWMREQNIWFNVRGSAAGSLTCWALGITEVDPIEWDLPFELFLSAERPDPPDIDIDVEHTRKKEVVDWVSERFFTYRIGSWARLRMHGTDRGSLVELWKHNHRHHVQKDADPNAGEVNKLLGLRDYPIVDSFSVNAAGMIVAPNESTAQIIPLQLSGNGTLATAFNKDDCQRLGMVKLDILDLPTMTAMRHACQSVGVSLEQIPLNDAKTFDLICSGRTTGLFQLKGFATSQVVRRVKPRTMEELIAVMALARPSAIKSNAINLYVDRTNAPARAAILQKHVETTRGVLLYTEQALAIMHTLGFRLRDVERIKEIIKSGDEKGMTRVRTGVAKQAKLLDLSPTDMAWLDDVMSAYANYGFKKSHATSYGIFAYKTAWMRAHHPAAFWAGMLTAYANSSGDVDLVDATGSWVTLPYGPGYREAARLDGVSFLRPHINKSSDTWLVVDEKTIQCPLTVIRGIGSVVAREIGAHQPFTGLGDVTRQCAPNRVTGLSDVIAHPHSPATWSGAISALYQAGALDGLADVLPTDLPPEWKESA